jgi:hypothetical protein
LKLTSIGNPEPMLSRVSTVHQSVSIAPTSTYGDRSNFDCGLFHCGELVVESKKPLGIIHVVEANVMKDVAIDHNPRCCFRHWKSFTVTTLNLYYPQLNW